MGTSRVSKITVAKGYCDLSQLTRNNGGGARSNF